MELHANDVNKRLKLLFGPYEDGVQDAWVEILEHDPQTVNEIGPIAKKARNRGIRDYT
jgi:hypothetical protein